MSIMTGLIIVVAMAVLAQKSDSLYDFFSREEVARIAPQNDASTLVAGSSQVIDVLANDENAEPEDGGNLRIVVSPSCGAAEATPDGVLYISNERCVGPQLFAYCVARGDECPSASVTVTVTEGAPVGSVLVSDAGDGQEQRIAVGPTSAPAARTTVPATASPATNTPAAAPQVTDNITAPRVATPVEQPGAPASQSSTVANPQGAVVAAINPVRPQFQSPSLPTAGLTSSPEIGNDDGGAGDIAVAALNDASEPSVQRDSPRSPVLRDEEAQTKPNSDTEVADRPRTPTLRETVAAEPASRPDVSNIENQPEAPETPPTEVASLQPPSDQSTTDRARDEEVAAVRRERTTTSALPIGGASCDLGVRSSAASGGSSRIRLQSDCRANELFEINHGNLRFSGQFDGSGRGDIDIPVLDTGNGITILTQDGTLTPAEMQYNRREVELTLRVAVAWTAPVDLDLHAFEYAAGFGADGHVWQESPRGFRLVRRGGGGFLANYPALSAGGQSIEVYTFWANSRARRGTARIAVDHASRGNLPDGAFCGDGEFATPSYVIVKSNRGELETVTRSRFAPAACGQSLEEDARYVSSALNDLRIE